ncbi:MAG: hypothetical protein QOG49_1794 [Frankiaceae bacterium]|nr:hypothetical protein [Frankiaceae bacterium]
MTRGCRHLEWTDVRPETGLGFGSRGRDEVTQVHGASDPHATALVELSQTLAEAVDDEPRIGRLITERIAELIGDAVSMWLLSTDGTTLTCTADAHRDPEARRLLDDLVTTITYDRSSGNLWPAVRDAAPFVIWEVAGQQSDPHPALAPYLDRYGTRSLAAVPMRIRGRPIGVIGGTRVRDAAPYVESDVVFMQALADVAALALDNARLLAASRVAETEIRRAAQLVEQVSDAIISTDGDWRIESWNTAAESIYGHRRTDAIGRPLDLLLGTTFLTASGAPVSTAQVRRALAADGAWRGETRERHADGREIELAASITALAGDDHATSRVIFVNRDLSDQRAAARLVASRERQSRSMLDAVDAAAAILDADGVVVSVNAGWLREDPGLPPPGADYLTCCTVLDPDDGPAMAEGVRRVLSRGAPSYQLEYVRGEEADARWFNFQVWPLGDERDGVVVSHSDITWRRRLEVDLAHQTTHDALTGLPNRVLLSDRLPSAIERAARSATSIAVLFVDLDRFKLVNDSLGHDAGDVVLRAAAQRLLSVVRPVDTVARFGGDEFVVVLEGVDRDGAVQAAERLIAAFREPIEVDGRRLDVGASIGISVSSGGDTPEAILRDADAAMYRAKENGRGQFQVFDQSTATRAARRVETEHALRAAVANDDLLLLYQPQFDIRTGHVVGVEALLRWNHADLGLLGAWSVVPLAEETGLILPIGRWALRTAVAQAVEFAAAGHPIGVSVNLSALQLAEPDLVDVVKDTLTSAGLAPELLCLEITESAVIGDPVTAGEKLQQLSTLGVRIAVDDFGTGYSSITYLRTFPIDTIKIDQSFVMGLGQEVKDEAVVTAIVDLARNLGVTAIAEGVETPEQLAELRRIGCDFAQGFLLGRPQPAPDVLICLRAAGRRGTV